MLLNGYGLFWVIIEMLRNEKDYKLDLNENTYRAIKTLTNTNIDIEEYIKKCIDDYKLFVEEDQKFYSESLLDRMLEYERKKAINQANGKLGGRPPKTEKKPNGFQNETEKNQSKVKESKIKENKIKETKEKENKEKEKGQKQVLTEGNDPVVLETWETQFNKFYSAYPRKVKKQKVKEWFMKNTPSNELFSSIMDSLEQFRASRDWQKDGGRFIPHPSTWLNQRRWEDETVDQSSFDDFKQLWEEAKNE